MNKKSLFLLGQAREKMAELSRHPVLSRYWAQMSLVLKGSTARGNADRYSDIDLVFYTTEKARLSIVSGYHALGLTDRMDGVFIHFANGHYHIESYARLRTHFAHKDFMRCWEVEHTVVLSDPKDRFGQIVRAGQQQLFQNYLDILKRAYLDLQLDLDWMRMPITRGDSLATLLHAAKIIQGLCRVSYLLDKRSFPPDKWVARYLSSTRWGRTHGQALQGYLKTCDQVNTLVVNRPFAENPLYQEAAVLIGEVRRSIQKTHGPQPWLEQWCNYV